MKCEWGVHTNITKNGKVISKLTNPNQEKVDIAKSLFGILPNVFDADDIHDERLSKK